MKVRVDLTLEVDTLAWHGSVHSQGRDFLERFPLSIQDAMRNAGVSNVQWTRVSPVDRPDVAYALPADK